MPWLERGRMGQGRALHKGGSVSDGGGGGGYPDGVCAITHIHACGRTRLLVLMLRCGV